ncbi:hypothetical protein LCL96_01230 [Rossellomorea aquimaris]|uniref:hypothetical protein n=1 Tax=Rossellomorea aquimaris TaxID=189382 RepID=UPI001CD19F4A|nr:hypothetical protein [Rossellomorea aquimaris]MCA1057538.1 hypothetical protein [Rossellomorea aquimaris]
MKQTNNFSLIFLGVCVLAGAWMVSNSLNNNGNQKAVAAVDQVTVVTPQEHQLLNHLELKEYLGINDEQLEKILPKKEGNVTTSEIPYIKIGYTTYFPVKAIDKWLTETEAETFQ